MPKATKDCVLKLWRHVTLQSPKSREKNEGRRYFDYCEITTTEYKWTTVFIGSIKKALKKLKTQIEEALWFHNFISLLCEPSRLIFQFSLNKV
jgi:hypothetical protein